MDSNPSLTIRYDIDIDIYGDDTIYFTILEFVAISVTCNLILRFINYLLLQYFPQLNFLFYARIFFFYNNSKQYKPFKV